MTTPVPVSHPNTLHPKAVLADLDEIRRDLPIAYVMEVFGHQPVAEADGRLHYHNPFRDDENPSFDVFVNDKGVQRWGDFAWEGGKQGGVIDLVGLFVKAPDNNNKTAIIHSRELYSAFLREPGWKGPVVQPRKPHPVPLETRLKDAGPLTKEVWHTVLEGRQGLIQGEGNRKLARFDPADWELQQQETNLVIPYRHPKTREIVGARYRDLQGGKWMASGSKMVPYCQPYAGQGSVLLVEGETDTWACTASFSKTHWVVGIPGVGHRPEKMIDDLFDGLKVYVAFDGDEPGRAASVPWCRYFLDRNLETFFVPVPEDADWAKLPASLHEEVLSRARPVTSAASDLLASPTGYALQMAQNTRPVSNFILEPNKVFRSEDGAYWYRVSVFPGGEDAVLPDTALSTPQSLSKWARQHRKAWYGGSTDHSRLAALLQHQAIFLPEGNHVTRPGLFRSTFVWPGHKIGPDDVQWVEGGKISNIEKSFYISSNRKLDSYEIGSLFQAYSLDVITPMLAWLALAPLRSKYERFPILFITGKTGSGKTSLTSRMLHVVTGSHINLNLTSTTPYAAGVYYAASNAFPVWIDEYRPGANPNALNMVNQLIRDGYMGQESVRGGMSSDLTSVTVLKTDSPVIITGEDFASEESHRDRMIKLHLNPVLKGSLTPLEEIGHRNLAWGYLNFLAGSNPLGEVYVANPPKVVPYGPEALTDRQRYNNGILKAGWDLFTTFLMVNHNYHMAPELDLTQVLRDSVESAQIDQVAEVLLYLYENGSREAVWVGEQGCYVRPGAVVQLASAPWFPYKLPFSSPRALALYLAEVYQGQNVVTRHPLTRASTRAVKVSKSLLGFEA